jgi:hypothetical protein
MAPEVAAVEQALLALAPRDRAAVVHAGLLSLDHASGADIDQAGVDAAWRDEIATRLDEVLAGTVQLGTFEETYARFTAKYPVVGQ